MSFICAVSPWSAFVYFEAYGSLAPWVGALNAADEASRYKEEEVTIEVPRRANLSARVVRPKMAVAALPACAGSSARVSPRE